MNEVGFTNRVASRNAVGNRAVTVTICTYFGFKTTDLVNFKGNVECLKRNLLCLNSKQASISAIDGDPITRFKPPSVSRAKALTIKLCD